MTYEKIFTDVKKAFNKTDTKKLNYEFAFQFNITGSGEGVFYVAYKNSVLHIQPYDYKDNNGVLYASGDVFIKIANGVLSLKKAVNDGFLRIEGDTELAYEIEKLALEKTAAGKIIDKKEVANILEEKTVKKRERPVSEKTTGKSNVKIKKINVGFGNEEDFDSIEATNFIDSADYDGIGYF